MSPTDDLSPDAKPNIKDSSKLRATDSFTSKSAELPASEAKPNDSSAEMTVHSMQVKGLRQ